MKSYTVNRPNFKHDGKRVEEGGKVELTEKAAGPLLATRAILEPDAAVDLAGMKVPELKRLAEKAGIEGFANMTKPELITALQPSDQKDGEQ